MGATTGDEELGALEGFTSTIEPAVFGGLVVQSRHPSDAAVVSVLVDAVERVVQECMGVELTWTTSAVVGSDDLSSLASDTGRPGIDWDFVLGRGEPLQSVTLTAMTTALAGHHEDPKWLPVTVRASMPVPVAQGRGDGGGLVVAVSMHRWAMYGAGADLVRVAGFLSPWLLDAAERLGADTGFVTLDQVTAEDDQSPWERVNRCAPALRDATRTLWGYGWGTLLSPAHVEAIGGRSAVDALRDAVPALHVGEIGGRMWVTLGPDPAAVTREDVVALRRTLLPGLPTGPRTVEQYERAVEQGDTIERYVV